MKKTMTINVITLITYAVLSFFAYYILLLDNCLHTSIGSIIAKSHGMEITEHLLVLGILPFYIAAVIFGTAMLSTYLGSIITQLCKRFKSKTTVEKAEDLRDLPSSM